MLKLLDKYKNIIEYTRIHKFEQFGLNFRLRVEIGLIDKSVLHVRETIIEENIRKYSYHWQNDRGKLIVRWDNAPDWEVETFPHHKHIGDGIESSYERTLEQVLKIISSDFEKEKLK